VREGEVAGEVLIVMKNECCVFRLVQHAPWLEAHKLLTPYSKV
jgi:hypothetical protein